MNKTSIAWTDYTSNPIRARNIETGKMGHYCTHVSEGCENCYAGVWNRDRFGTGLDFIAQNRDRVEMFLVEEELREWSKPKYAGARVFVCDMTDWCHELVTDEMRDKLFAAMALASGVTFQLLTKRPEKMREYLNSEATRARIGSAGWALDPHGLSIYERHRPWPFANIWLGVTAENQRWANERIPVLLDTPSAVRFVSYEPALGPISLMPWLPCHCSEGPDSMPNGCNECAHPVNSQRMRHFDGVPIDWVIVGGESGANARPFDPAWARAVVSQCAGAGVACFVKQMGGKRFPDDRLESLPEDLRVREFPR